MKVTILGCGGSLGVPQIACNCYVCTSEDPKNFRTRASILIESNETSILIDAAPDFRSQALVNKIQRIDAVILTHPHSDHLTGLDDLKPYYQNSKKQIPVYMTAHTWRSVERSYPYLFKDTGSSIYKPIMREVLVESYDLLEVGEIKVQLFEQEHGEITSLGIRVGDFAYSTDMNRLNEKSLNHLTNLKTWVVDCLRYSWAPSHSCYEQTLKLIEIVTPHQTILTHMAHEIDFHEISKILPHNIQPAFDGMQISVT